MIKREINNLLIIDPQSDELDVFTWIRYLNKEEFVCRQMHDYRRICCFLLETRGLRRNFNSGIFIIFVVNSNNFHF